MTVCKKNYIIDQIWTCKKSGLQASPILFLFAIWCKSLLKIQIKEDIWKFSEYRLHPIPLCHLLLQLVKNLTIDQSDLKKNPDYLPHPSYSSLPSGATACNRSRSRKIFDNFRISDITLFLFVILYDSLQKFWTIDQSDLQKIRITSLTHPIPLLFHLVWKLAKDTDLWPNFLFAKPPD